MLGAFLVALNGCDDSTEFVITMTAEQEVFLTMLSILSRHTSTYGWSPVLSVENA